MRRWVVVGVVMLVVGCASTDPASTATEPDRSAPSNAPAATSPAEESPPTTSPSSAPELAPSQITASTVERPVTPPTCRVETLTMWTASIDPGVVGVRIRNDGTVWCDVDITGSARLDPLAEPAIWLEPGDAATLVASESEPDCEAPTTIRTLEFDVGGVGVSVPTALATCSWRLTALYPVDAPTASCAPDHLTARWFDVHRVLAVRLVAGPPCTLAGAEADLYDRGDVVVWVGDDCDASGDPLPFATPEVVVPGLPTCVVWGAGPGGVATVAAELAGELADGSVDV